MLNRIELAITMFALTSLSVPLFAQSEPQSGSAKSIQDAAVISQTKGADQRVDYQSLKKYGPWDDRNYNVTQEDLSLIPEKDQYLSNVPVFFKVFLRKEQPNLGEFYPRSALQRFQILHCGLLVNGILYKEGLGVDCPDRPSPDEKKEGKAFSAEELARLQDGQVMIQVWLADTKEEALSQLKELGFKSVAQPKSSHLVIGYISVEQLEMLAKLSIVRYVTLQPSVS